MFFLYRDAHKEAKGYDLGSLRKNIQKLPKRTAIKQVSFLKTSCAPYYDCYKNKLSNANYP